MEIERDYVRIQVLFKAFQQAFSFVINVIIGVLILGIIMGSYISIKFSTTLPPFLWFISIQADIWFIIMLRMLLVLLTNAHLQSQALIKISKCGYIGFGKDSKFWAAIKPLRVDCGQVCSLETREFLLVIAWRVIIASTIDLLLTF